MEIGNPIRVCGGAMRLVVVSLVVIRMTVLTASWLRYIWNNLHPPWDHAGRSAGTGGICRGSWAPKSFGQLLDKGLSDIICSDVNSVSHTKNNQGPFSRQRQA
jgi:hypothetical protein